MTYKYVVNFTGQARESDKLPVERFDQLWFINQYNYGSLGYYNLLTRGAFRFLGWEYHFDLPRFIVYHQDMWGVVHAPSASVLMELWEDDLMFIAPLPTNLLSEDME